MVNKKSSRKRLHKKTPGRIQKLAIITKGSKSATILPQDNQPVVISPPVTIKTSVMKKSSKFKLWYNHSMKTYEKNAKKVVLGLAIVKQIISIIKMFF